MILKDKSASFLENGNKSIDVATLNSVCKLAICAAGKSLEYLIIIWSIGMIKEIVTKIRVPIMLKSTWTRAVLLAFFDEPIDDKTDVIQVPILNPNIIYIDE